MWVSVSPAMRFFFTRRYSINEQGTRYETEAHLFLNAINFSILSGRDRASNSLSPVAASVSNEPKEQRREGSVASITGFRATA